MAFIYTIPEEQAGADVKKMVAENIAEFGYLPNYGQAFSLRPIVSGEPLEYLSWYSRRSVLERLRLPV